MIVDFCIFLSTDYVNSFNLACGEHVDIPSMAAIKGHTQESSLMSSSIFGQNTDRAAVCDCSGGQ